MATVINQRDTLLLATVPRMLNVTSNYISLNSATNSFYTNYSGTQPSQILIKANLAGELKGTVTWTVSPTVANTVDGNYITIPATSVQVGTIVTVTATLQLYGQTYTSSLILSNSSETVTSSLSTNIGNSTRRFPTSIKEEVPALRKSFSIRKVRRLLRRSLDLITLLSFSMLYLSSSIGSELSLSK